MISKVSLIDGHLAVTFPFSREIVAAVKDVDPRRRWDGDGKQWLFPVEEHVLRRLVDLLDIDEAAIDEPLKAMLTQVEDVSHEDLPDVSEYRWEVKPYAHQVKALAQMVKHNQWLLNHEQGTGKSFIIAARLRRGSDSHEFNGPVLIVCPKSVVSVWEDELMKHGNGLSSLWLGTGAKARGAALSALKDQIDRGHPLPILVANYEGVRVERERLAKIGFDVVVADECVPAGSKISTTFGLKNIEDLRANDAVLGYDHDARNIVPTTVIACFSRSCYSGDMIVIEGQHFTREHRIWTKEDGYVAASEVASKQLPVVRMAVVSPMAFGHKSGKVYNIETTTNNYFVGGILVHNCQRVKDAAAKSSRALQRIAVGARYRWALSGTPAPNSPLDWFGTMMFLDPSGGLAGTASKIAFRNRYAVLAPRDGWAQIVGYQNLDDLKRRVRAVSDRVTKAEALDLPPKVYVTRTCQLDGGQRRIYREMKLHAVAELKSLQGSGQLTARNVLTVTGRLLQVAGGFVPDDAGVMHALEPNAKMAVLRDVIDETDSQVIVWCAFIAECRAVHWWLSERARKLGVTAVKKDTEVAPRSSARRGAAQHNTAQGILPNTALKEEPVLFTGHTSDADRKEAVERFQAGEARFFVGTAQAGGLGITLTAASTVIYYSRNWSLEKYLQSSDRAHRIGQTKKVTIITLIAEDTVDLRVDVALEKKQSLQELIAGGDIDKLV